MTQPQHETRSPAADDAAARFDAAPLDTAPLPRVVRGNPTDEELAALVAVVALLSARPRPAEHIQPRPRPGHRNRYRSAVSWRGGRI